jgi:acetyl-CoA carboxylase / biotin carboxylase 1
MLSQIETFSDRFGAFTIQEELKNALKNLSGMKEKVYGEIALAADSIIRQSEVPSFSKRVGELRSRLLESSTDLDALSKSTTLSAGVDLLTGMFNDADKICSQRSS